MERLTYRFTLDAFRGGYQRTIQGIQSGDKVVRRFCISLMSGGDTYELPVDGNVTAAMYIMKPTATDPCVNACEIEGDNIIYDLTAEDVEMIGITTFQLKIIGVMPNGAERVLIAPRFKVEVSESIVEDGGAEATETFTALENALAQAKAYYNKRIKSVDIVDKIFTIYYADGTVYESECFSELLDRIDNAELLRVEAEEQRVISEEGRVEAELAREEKVKRAEEATKAAETIVSDIQKLIDKGGLVTETEKERWNEAGNKMHTHENKDTIDSISDDDLQLWDSAYQKAHEHSNKNVLDDISGDDVAAWRGQILTKSNLSVPVASWCEDATYEDYPYRAGIECTGVTQAYVPTVNLALHEAISGIFAPVAECTNDTVYIYASEIPEADITIPSIVCVKGVVA